MVQTGLKIDGRTLTRETLEGMRFMALDRMAEGESLAAISASFGMHRAWAVWLPSCSVPRRGGRSSPTGVRSGS